MPDPFSGGDGASGHESFAHHNNARLRKFLDQFGFEYEFFSATDCYQSGMMDETLLKMLAVYDKVMGIILPTIGEARQKTYSPFLPVCPRTGKVLQVPMIARDVAAGTVTYVDPETGDEITTPVTGGRVKCQWKADWAMRWTALGVDYEMYGKDLIDSGVQSGKIARVLGGRPPEGLIYEMFLDEKGEKISKSKGNGLTLEQWLDYGTQESLSFFAYREPKKAKQLHIGVIPRAVDEYFQFRGSYAAQPVEQKLGNPVHHIHNAAVPDTNPPVTFGLLLNLVGVLGAGATAEQVHGYLSNYIEGAVTPELDALIGHALAYNRDYVAPTLQRRKPEGIEVAALERLDRELANAPADSSAVDLQNIVYAIGNEGGFDPLRAWFGALYETLLGSTQGPRMGSFIALYGIDNTRTLIAEALAD